jgi:hypothetical protein
LGKADSEHFLLHHVHYRRGKPEAPDNEHIPYKGYINTFVAIYQVHVLIRFSYEHLYGQDTREAHKVGGCGQVKVDIAPFDKSPSYNGAVYNERVG